MHRSANRVDRLAPLNFTPLPIGEELIFALEDEEGFVLIRVLVRRGTTAWWRSLCHSRRLVPRHFRSRQDVDELAENLKAFHWV